MIVSLFLFFYCLGFLVLFFCVGFVPLAFDILLLNDSHNSFVNAFIVLESNGSLTQIDPQFSMHNIDTVTELCFVDTCSEVECD